MTIQDRIKGSLKANGYKIIEVGGSGCDFNGCYCRSKQTDAIMLLFKFSAKGLMQEEGYINGYEVRIINDRKSTELAVFTVPCLKNARQMAETYVTMFCDSLK